MADEARKKRMQRRRQKAEDYLREIVSLAEQARSMLNAADRELRSDARSDLEHAQRILFGLREDDDTRKLFVLGERAVIGSVGEVEADG